MKSQREYEMSVRVFANRAEMGLAAARDAAGTIGALLSARETLNIVFAAAPSQTELLENLAADPAVDFSRLRAFQMDEYSGLQKDSPQTFFHFLDEHLYGKKKFCDVFRLRTEAADAEAECRRYAALLAAYPPDLVFMGIGENGHIAFNDPGIAEFADPQTLKVVRLEPASREQQVHDGCFSRLDEVPTHAMTMTVPALMRAREIFCVVPAKSKAAAVRDALEGEISESCPASILRTASRARLYLDSESAGLLLNRPGISAAPAVSGEG